LKPPLEERPIVEQARGSDLVALAQCFALDATVFPHPSLPPVLDATGAAPTVWFARLPQAPRSEEQAETLGPVIGFLGAIRQRRTLEVVGVAVEAAHRRRGVGRALVRAAVASCASRGLSAVGLHVSTGNLDAARLYETEGFRVVRTLRGYYSARRFPHGGDAWRMELAVSATPGRP
jgi:ribosomal protein S18 acetylase RimI-like enzyme